MPDVGRDGRRGKQLVVQPGGCLTSAFLVVGGELPALDPEEVVEVDIGTVGLTTALRDQRDHRGQRTRAGGSPSARPLEPSFDGEGARAERRSSPERDVVICSVELESGYS